MATTAPPELCLEWIEQGGNATTPAPLVVIVLATYKRTDMAVRTINGLCQHLDYPQQRRTWYIADDGSPGDHMNQIFDALMFNGETMIGYHNQKFSPGTLNPGIGWNRGLETAHQYSEFVLWMEDDWELRDKFDIRPFVRLLMGKKDIGLIRFGTIAAGNNVFTEGYAGIHYVSYLKSSAYAYSGNPNLSHKRFWDAYGHFATDRNPGEIELSMDYNFRTKTGPQIWRPLQINPWGQFHHIGRERTFS